MRRALCLTGTTALGVVLLMSAGCPDAKLKPEIPLEYQFVLPDDYDPEYEYPLLVAMHDGGSSEDYAFRAWDEEWFDKPDFILLAVRAPFKAGGGFSWIKRTDVTDPAALYANLRGSALTSTARLVEVVDEFEQEYAIDPDWIFALGIRQSADIAIFAALRYPEYFSGVAALRGNFDTTLLAPRNFDAVERIELFFAVPKDTSSEGKRAERLWEMLEPFQTDVKFDRQSTNRAYNKETCRALQEYFGLTANEKGEEGWREEEYFDDELIEE